MDASAVFSAWLSQWTMNAMLMAATQLNYLEAAGGTGREADAEEGVPHGQLR